MWVQGFEEGRNGLQAHARGIHAWEHDQGFVRAEGKQSGERKLTEQRSSLEAHGEDAEEEQPEPEATEEQLHDDVPSLDLDYADSMEDITLIQQVTHFMLFVPIFFENNYEERLSGYGR